MATIMAELWSIIGVKCMENGHRLFQTLESDVHVTDFRIVGNFGEIFNLVIWRMFLELKTCQ